MPVIEVTAGGQSNADELARARDRLRKVEREMRVVFESMTDAVFILESAHWTFQYLNPQAERMFGRTREELVGRNVWAEFPDETANGVAKGHYETAVATQQTVSFEAYYSPLDRWVEVRAYRNPGAVAVYVKDISERKLIEQNLRAAEARFRRVFDLQFQFIAVVSPEGRIQEVNELPLPLITVTREQIIGELFWEAHWWTRLPDARRIWRGQFEAARASEAPMLFEIEFHTADGSMRHSSNAITGVRNAASAVEYLIVQGHDVVLEDLEERLRETGGRVETRGLPSIVGDRTQLGQLSQNLIFNALKFRAPGVAPRVEISAVESELQGAPAWTITISGIGFASEFRERIFAPFHRLHGRSEFEGTGIGLAIVRRIVEGHGGIISADGNPELGAIFRVQLPQAGGVGCGELEPNSIT